jgi:hypothetical protein
MGIQGRIFPVCVAVYIRIPYTPHVAPAHPPSKYTKPLILQGFIS